MNIHLPDNFTSAHRVMVLRFVQGKPVNDHQRATQLEAFDRLHRATAGSTTFADFYITRLYRRFDKERLLVVFLKQPVWDAIDGEALATTLAALPDVLPAVAEIEHDGQTFIVVEYKEWKTRILKHQHRKGGEK
jgi:hypothetical protein